MHYAVGRLDVGGGDLGAVDKDNTAIDPDRQALALDGRDDLAVAQVLVTSTGM